MVLTLNDELLRVAARTLLDHMRENAEEVGGVAFVEDCCSPDKTSVSIDGCFNIEEALRAAFKVCDVEFTDS